MVISARLHKASKSYRCDDCRKTIPAGETYYRLFGMADRPDPPYEIKLHAACYVKPIDEEEKANG